MRYHAPSGGIRDTFHQGLSRRAYEMLGSHPCEEGGRRKWHFCVWAPNAKHVALVGSFNHYDRSAHPMKKQYDGTWELRLDEEILWRDVPEDGYPTYKYAVWGADDIWRMKADPYAFHAETRPGTASKLYELAGYDWGDGAYLAAKQPVYDRPLNIYEVHLGSWRTDPGDPNGWYKYEDIAPQLVKYCKEHGYNCVELMPLNEYPCDESWGYQATGFFSPTSRYGTAEGLKKLVNTCHKNGIAVLMDYVPVHFAVDGYALAQFDGTPTYESQFKDIAFSEWGSCNFDFTKGPVCSFLKSAANYWLTEYHFDGLRMDAISRVIYYMGDPSRGENVCGVKFLKSLNRGLKWINPSAILCAEDSTDYPMVTKPVDEGGLGFDYKWDMGWMNDTLNYFRTPPDERVNHYHKLTFSMMYYYSEKYILPLSHDENVHGKATVIQKMYGDYDDKFPQARALYMYMYAHPGKKLNFMGSELAQFREWDEKREQDWDILKYPMHDGFMHFMKKLCNMYLEIPSLSRWDDAPEGFRWLDCDSALKRCYTMLRSCDGGAPVAAVFNLSDRVQDGYVLNVGQGKRLKLLLDSTEDRYGGCAPHYPGSMTADQNGNVKLSVPRYSAAYYEVADSVPKGNAGGPANQSRHGQQRRRSRKKKH